jgi:hypothetical protein
VSTVKLTYTETWRRETTTDVDLDDVRAWAAKKDEDPAAVEITPELISEYLQADWDYAGPDIPGWHPGGNGLEGYGFDALDIQTAEVIA